MVIKGYFDDSGDEKKNKFAVVGGVIAYENVWSHFELMWANATYDLKKPFHAADCEAQRGCCEGWTVQQSISMMKKLTDIIEETGLGVFGSIISIPEYRAVFPKSGEYDPYYLAVKHSIINMAYLGRLSAHDLDFRAISVMHEEGDRTGRVYEIFKEMKLVSSWPDAKYLDGFSIGSKRVNGLQVADLVAREAFKHVDNLGERPIRKPVKKLKNQTSFHLWTRECLEYLRDNGGQNNLTFLTAWGQTGDKFPQMTRLYRDRFDEHAWEQSARRKDAISSNQ
jgi:hypothetical protein